MLLLVGLNNSVLGSNTATQTVTIQVQAINEIAVSGTVSIVYDQAHFELTREAGQDLNGKTDNSSSLSWTTNGTNKKITVHIDGSDFTPTVKVTVDDTNSSGTAYVKNVDPTPRTIIDGIGNEAVSNATLTYSLNPTVTDGVLSETRTVVYTLTE